MRSVMTLLAAMSGVVWAGADTLAKTYIVIPHRASPTENFAGTELQRYLGRITGQTPDLHLDHPAWGDPQRKDGPTFVVGRTRFAQPFAAELEKLGTDGFIMRHQGNVLFLVGGGDRGTLFAVYAYLERAGCRWFGPTHADEHLPQVATLPFKGIDEAKRPAFACRELVDFTGIDERNIDWCVKNGLNRAGHQSRLDAAWGHVIAEQWRRRGGTVMVRHSPVHNFANLVPAGLFAEHPEYFALIDGERRVRAMDAYWQAEFTTQFCTSNAAVVDRVRRDVVAWFDAHPDYEVFALSPVDGGQWCQCDRCRAMDARPGVYSERLVTLANQVAETLVAKHPGKQVMILAYDNYKYAPRGVRPHRNVIVQFCPWPDIQQPLSRQTDDGAIYAGALRDWAKLTDNLAVWSYVFYIGSNNAPPAISIRALAEDLRYYRKIGVKRVLSQFGADLYAQQPAALYAWTRLTWDTDLDPNALIKAFCHAYYGAAGAPMTAFHTLVEDANAKRCATNLLAVYTPDVVKQARALLDQAAQAVADDRLRRERVAVVRSQVDRAAALRPPEILADRWVHVAFTWDFPAGKFALDLDGRRAAEFAESLSAPKLAPEFVIGRQHVRADAVSGMVDELHLSDVPRDTFPSAGPNARPVVPDAHTTMLCHFDGALNADLARGDGTVRPPRWPLTSPEFADAGPFGQAALMRSSGTLGKHDALRYWTQGNLDARRGTTSLRYRPSLWRVGPLTCTLLDARDGKHPDGFWLRLDHGAVVVHFGGKERLRAEHKRAAEQK